jgi:hypothetical protein
MDKTKSVKAAARYLNCSYHHLKPLMKSYKHPETGESLFDLALRTSATHKAYFLDLYQPNEAVLRRFAEEADESLRKAEAMAAAPRGDFDQYLADYFS